MKRELRNSKSRIRRQAAHRIDRSHPLVANFKFRVLGSGLLSRAIVQLVLLLLLAGPAAAQQVVDRIVARIEGDIITRSEVLELAAFQRLVSGAVESADPDRAEMLRRVIEQWIVATEADAAHFPRPSREDVERELERLEQSVAPERGIESRLREAGLSRPAVERLIARQLFLARYLDYKFRPAVLIEQGQVERYFNQELLPELRRRGEPLPPLARVQDKIRELLVQKEISARAARWLDESRSRLRIEIMPEGASR